MLLSLSELAQQLIQKISLTPDDADCQNLLKTQLEQCGFQILSFPCGPVQNLWARYGTQAPLLVFAGHTDVVPTEPESEWQYPPFSGTIAENNLHGRGAQDMKSSLAAMAVACQRFIEKYPTFLGSIGFLITSNEEGDAIGGTAYALEQLKKKGVIIDHCLVGEASCDKKLGDTLKIGRRGSLHATVTFKGIGGHIAYPQKTKNPIHSCFKALDALCHIEWDKGNQYFPPTSFQISNIQGGTGADNVVPSEVKVTSNFRYSPELTEEEIKKRFMEVLDSYSLNYEIHWKLSGEPFLSTPQKLTSATQQALQEICHLTPQLSTSGGTSDGRFIAKNCPEVIEFGPVNDTIHKPNERISLEELNQLTLCYEQILKNLFNPQ